MLRKRAGLDALSSTEGPGIRTSEGGGGVLRGKKTSEGPLGQEGKASPVAFEVCCVYPIDVCRSTQIILAEKLWRG